MFIEENPESLHNSGLPRRDAPGAMMRQDPVSDQSRPAPLAHLYFAPSTSTGSSVE
jgi:hypothetical protein